MCVYGQSTPLLHVRIRPVVTLESNSSSLWCGVVAMDYLTAFPEGFLERSPPDWALQVKDGSFLPFHGNLLCSISPVAEGLASTPPPENSKYAVEVPFKQEVGTATAFLKWLYHQQVGWTLTLAKELAWISHFWNIQGEYQHCHHDIIQGKLPTLSP
jgi:hypothetical protein